MLTGDKQPFVTNTELKLTVDKLRSDVKLWLIAAVVANQGLAHIELPAPAGFVGAAVVVAAVIIKTAVLR
jgi:hypothetical protein